MEVYRTQDNQVAKYIHDDGSETAIKTVGSCNNEVGLISTARNKYSVFVSVSSGCRMKCRFCYLTIKKCGYASLAAEEITKNVVEALDVEAEHKPEIKNKYIKLSWMGMGDALPHGDIVKEVSKKVLDYVFEKGYAKGLDGVDLATVYPNFKNIYFNNFIALNHLLTGYKFNPEHADRSRFRFFYSLHSTIPKVRDIFIPGSASIIRAVEDFNTLSTTEDIDIIYHHMFLDKKNDSVMDVNALIDFMNNPINKEAELRVLRFNACVNSPYKESETFETIIDLLSTRINKLKYQVSTGSEIKAACGQFLLKRLEEN